MDVTRLPRQALEYRLKGKRPRGCLRFQKEKTGQKRGLKKGNRIGVQVVMVYV